MTESEPLLLTKRQRALHTAVLAMASSIDEQMMIVTVMAGRHACSEHDVRVVREILLTGHVREARS